MIKVVKASESFKAHQATNEKRPKVPEIPSSRNRTLRNQTSLCYHREISFVPLILRAIPSRLTPLFVLPFPRQSAYPLPLL